MSDDKKYEGLNPDDYECGRCGKNGFPSAECKLCEGRAPIQARAYTLSDERAGRAPKVDRYGDDGALGPKIIKLPGSGNPGGGT